MRLVEVALAMESLLHSFPDVPHLEKNLSLFSKQKNNFKKQSSGSLMILN